MTETQYVVNMRPHTLQNLNKYRIRSKHRIHVHKMLDWVYFIVW